MKSACLILIVAGRLITVDKPFPHPDACEQAGFGMVDGQTVKGYACLPRFMVDGLPTYDCGIVTDIDLTPPPGKCTFDVMDSTGQISTVAAPCAAQVPGTINMHSPEPRPPIPKYQKRME